MCGFASISWLVGERRYSHVQIQKFQLSISYEFRNVRYVRIGVQKLSEEMKHIFKDISPSSDVSLSNSICFLKRENFENVDGRNSEHGYWRSSNVLEVWEGFKLRLFVGKSLPFWKRSCPQLLRWLAEFCQMLNPSQTSIQKVERTPEATSVETREIHDDLIGAHW
jgi:hypothetical protein